jgi:hypothetical protein
VTAATRQAGAVYTCAVTATLRAVRFPGELVSRVDNAERSETEHSQSDMMRGALTEAA